MFRAFRGARRSVRVERASVNRQVRAMVAALTIALLDGCGGGGGGGGSSGPVLAQTPSLAITMQPQAATAADGQGVVFTVQANATGAVTYQWFRNGSPLTGATSASYAIAAVQLSDQGASFSVVVTAATSSVTSANALLTVTPVGPTLVDDRARTVMAMAGQPATFAVTATGSAPLTFQWRRDGVAIAGANAAIYVTGATTSSDNGAVFTVVVSNSAGSVTSAAATLAVTAVSQLPVIQSQPLSSTVRVGDPAQFNVGVSAPSTISYQWFRDGNAIVGATSQRYTLASTTLLDTNARFTVVVTDAAGSVTSSAAVLTVLPQPGVALLAGDPGGRGTIDGTGPTARFGAPVALARDAAGNLFVGDGSAVRKVDATGAVSTIAGYAFQTGSADGAGSVARFFNIGGVAVDSGGNVFIVDSGNHTVRRMTPAGVVTTFAGTAGASGATDGTGNAARFFAPRGITIDGANNLFVSEVGNNTIRKITPAGVVTTLAGSAGTTGTVDGTGSAARFNAPSQLVVASNGTLYVADYGNDTIRAITSSGVVTTVAGSPGNGGTNDGVGSAARFSSPFGIGLDAAGNLYVADVVSNRIRKVTGAGVVTTLAGVNGSGSEDGPAGGFIRFDGPMGIATTAAGVVFVADFGNGTIRQVGADGSVSTYAGLADHYGTTDGSGAAARFSGPKGIAIDGGGNVYVADEANSTIRKISPLGAVTTFAGSGVAGSADGNGMAARFNMPRAVAVDGAGNVYVADRMNHTIRKVTPAGVVGTLAGSAGMAGYVDAVGSAARLTSPVAVTVDVGGNVYFIDNTHVVRKIAPSGAVTTIAGAPNRGGSADGPGVSTASFTAPTGIVVDRSGRLFVADVGDDHIRMIDASGVVSTIVGGVPSDPESDGPVATARFSGPAAIAIDDGGNLFVADMQGRTLRRIDVSNVVTTVAGAADGLAGVRTGALPGHFSLPMGIAVDASGNLYVSDAEGVFRVTVR